MQFRIYRLIILFSLISALTFAQSGRADRINQLKEYIEEARSQWKVPGLAVVVVKDGEVLLQEGLGLRSTQAGNPVDDQTIFAICSTTKAMTAALMAMMVDEGKVNWDDRVIDHMPSFQLEDPYVTRELRIRDLFTHNSGMGNADLLWAVWVYPTDEILNRMRYLEHSYPFRGGYTYQNIMYATAGEILEILSGKSWEDLIQERIFDPLGMSNSYPNLARSQSQTNRSIPHFEISGHVVPITDRSADPIGAAGSVWSCAADMAKWVHFVLDSAKVNGNRLISAVNYREWLQPQVIVPDQSFYPTQQLTEPRWKTYALGWFQHDYAGKAVDFHTGSLRGTVAIIGLIREENLGVYVFGNLDHAELRHAIMYKVFDLFGETGQDKDWSTLFLELYSELQQRGNRFYEERISSKVPGTSTSYSLDKYEGLYENRYLGEVAVKLGESGLVAAIGEESVVLEHFHFDTFLVKWSNAPWSRDGFLIFKVDERGTISLDIFNHHFSKR